MVIKPEHKAAAHAILQEIHKQAKKIHGDQFKAKYKGEDAPGEEDADDEMKADGDSDPTEETNPEAEPLNHDGIDDTEDDETTDAGQDDDEVEPTDPGYKGHPDLVALRKLAKKHVK